MKEHMIGFYRPSDGEFNEIWNKAVFVLDANILLNLYRYPVKASQELLGALETLAGRLWLPYHAALEYQRNRLAIVAEQKKRFVDVRNMIEDAKQNLLTQINNLQLKKRHSSIEVEEFVEGFETLSKTFLEKLEKLDADQKNVSDEDHIRMHIDKIFSGNFASTPFDQKKLDEIYKEGESRYLIEMPPGYKDIKKEKSSEPDSFQYGGAVYKRKFGDLILWKQVIEYAKEKAIKHLVFLTDDEKEDWWWIVESQGKKKIGPRPELVEEISREGGVDGFYMYNSEQFLQYSKQYLQADISEESIAQVREVKLLREHRSLGLMQQYVFLAEQAVFEWLVSMYPHAQIERNQYGFPDFIVYDKENGRRIGYEVKVIRDPRSISIRLRDAAYRAYYELKEKKLDDITIIFALENLEGVDEAVHFSRRLKEMPPDVKIFFGLLDVQEDFSAAIFKPVADFTRQRDLFESA